MLNSSNAWPPRLDFYAYESDAVEFVISEVVVSRSSISCRWGNPCFTRFGKNQLRAV